MEGKCWKFGNDVNTDEIIPARYLNMTDQQELAAHCMEGVDPEFVHKVQLGDIIVAEPKALIGFTGARVIAQTLNTELPEGFQTAEFMLEHGFLDRIIHRRDLRKELALLLEYCKPTFEAAGTPPQQ